MGAEAQRNRVCPKVAAQMTVTRALALAGCLLLLSAAVLLAAVPEGTGRGVLKEPFPKAVSGYGAEGKTEIYDRGSVYDYMDGGAEVYLACGMKSLRVQRYARKGEPPITVDLFEMEDAAGAFGAFTFERLDEEAGIGQGSEYGGGQLRFWQGRHFAFIQSERETPASRQGVLGIGQAIAERLGPAEAPPKLASLLPEEGLRPLSVRYVLSPLLLETMERTALANPLGLPERCEAVVGRYGPKGSPERVLVAKFPSEEAAGLAVAAYLGTKFPGAERSVPFEGEGGWCAVASSGSCAIAVLGAPSHGDSNNRLEEVTRKVKGVTR